MRNKLNWVVSDQQMHCAAVLTILFAASAVSPAADFKGAAEVLQQASQAPSKSKEASKDPYAPFRDKLKAFASQSTNLPPDQAARQWLGLVDEFEKESVRIAGSARRGPWAGRPVQLEEVLEVLSPPASWAELEKAVEARSAAAAKGEQKRELGLRVIAHTLTGNTPKRAEDLKALDALAKSRNGTEASYEC